MTYKGVPEKPKKLEIYDLIPVCILVMDVLLIYAWLANLVQWLPFSKDAFVFNILNYLILAVATYIFFRFLSVIRISLKWVRLGALGFGIMLLLVMFRLKFSGGYLITDSAWFRYAGSAISSAAITAAAGLYLIWRAFNVLHDSKSFSHLYTQFVVKLSLLILLLIITGIIQQNSGAVWTDAGISVLSFFGLGILTLALVNFKSMENEFAGQVNTLSFVRRRWFFIMVLLVVVILTAAVLISSIFTLNLALDLLLNAKAAWEWLWDKIIYLFYIPGLIVQMLYYLFQLFRRDQPTEMKPFDMEDLQKKLEKPLESNVPDYLIIVLTILKWAVAAVIVALIIYRTWRSIKRFRKDQSEEGLEEENESLWSWSTFKADCRAIWDWLTLWMRRKITLVRVNRYTNMPAVRVDPTEESLFSVRDLYRALLWQGMELGIPRQPDETPYEYSHRLEIKTRDYSQGIAQITEAYIGERYGLMYTDTDQLKRLNKIWLFIRTGMSVQNS
jgi:hypothetical protein